MLLKIVCRGLRNFSICQSVNHNSSPLPAEYPQNALHAPAAASIDTENVFLKSRSHIHPKRRVNSTNTYYIAYIIVSVKVGASRLKGSVYTRVLITFIRTIF